MNYIEWALQRGAELWRAREEALKKRLSLVPEGTAQKKRRCGQGGAACCVVVSSLRCCILLRSKENNNVSDWVCWTSMEE